jgi:hypothetical protein
VSEHQAGVASGVNNAVSRVASLLSIAVLGIIAFHVFDVRLENKLNEANFAPEMKQAVMAQRSRLTQIEAPRALTSDQQQTLKHAINESFLAGFRWVMLVSAGLAILSALSAWAMIEGKAANPKASTPNLQPARKQEIA